MSLRRLENKKMSEQEREVKFLRKDKAKQIVYGVVYTPDEEDSEKEWANAKDIEEAAHTFLAKYRESKLSHRLQIDADIVESYIAPVDIRMPDNDLIKEGSWVVAMRVQSEELWKGIENGEITGFSMGGTKTYVST